MPLSPVRVLRGGKKYSFEGSFEGWEHNNYTSLTTSWHTDGNYSIRIDVGGYIQITIDLTGITTIVFDFKTVSSAGGTPILKVFVNGDLVYNIEAVTEKINEKIDVSKYNGECIVKMFADETIGLVW